MISFEDEPKQEVKQVEKPDYPDHIIITLPKGSRVRFAKHREVLQGGLNKVGKGSKEMLKELILRPFKHVQFSIKELLDKGFFTAEELQKLGVDMGLPAPEPEPEIHEVLPAPPDYGSMPLAKLKDLVREKNIKTKKGWKHEDYVKALVIHEEPANEDSD